MVEMPPPFTATATAFDTPRPGFVTVIWSHPTEAMSEASIKAVNCVALTIVVARSLPLKLTVVPLTKPVPFTLSVNVSPHRGSCWRECGDRRQLKLRMNNRAKKQRNAQHSNAGKA
jgi:hypothetical protein